MTRTILAAALAAVAALALAGTARADVLLPDLVADPPESPRVSAETDTATNTQRLLLRFNGYVHNKGPGDLFIVGDQPVSGEMTHVVQRLFGPGGASPWQEIAQPGARIIFETNDTHDHWHLKHVAQYSLWNEAGNAQVAPVQKAGFCLLDSQRVSGSEPARYPNPTNCDKHNPGATSTSMGITAGWRDLYMYTLAFQWVDISDVPPGNYQLRSDVDPEGFVDETQEANAPAWRPVTVPGQRARPVTAAGLPRGATSTITLAADAVTNPTWVVGAPSFRIEQPPAHGHLDVAPGTWFSGPDVQYTPDADAPGSDSFTFSARDATSGFPLSPAAAAVDVTLDGRLVAETVTISGAPPRLRARTSAQLSATVTGGAGPLVWTVDGGSAHGTVTQTGLYRAPAAVPPGGTATVRARTPTGVEGAVTMAIDPTPPSRPALAADVHGAGSRAFRTLRAVREGRVVAVSVVPRKTGRVRLTLMHTAKRLQTCSLRVRPGRTYVCRLRMRAQLQGGLSVAATLRPRWGGGTLQRRVAVAAHGD